MAVTLAGVLLPVGAAAEPGVIADPDTPTGKQYALPLDDARKGGSGGDRGSPGAGSPSRATGPGSPQSSNPAGPGSGAPAFGAGISSGERSGSGSGRVSGKAGGAGKAGAAGGDRPWGEGTRDGSGFACVGRADACDCRRAGSGARARARRGRSVAAFPAPLNVASANRAVGGELGRRRDGFLMIFAIDCQYSLRGPSRQAAPLHLDLRGLRHERAPR